MALRKAIAIPLMVSQTGKERQFPSSSTALSHGSPWSPPPFTAWGLLTGIVLSNPVVPCCCEPCWLHCGGRSQVCPFLCAVWKAVHLELPPHGSSRQCNGVSTMYYMRISLACWISDTLQQNTNCLFFFTAVLPSILSIHSPSACRRFTYFTCIGMVEETLLTCRFAFNRHPAQIGIKYICVSNREETRTSCRHK